MGLRAWRPHADSAELTPACATLSDSRCRKDGTSRSATGAGFILLKPIVALTLWNKPSDPANPELEEHKILPRLYAQLPRRDRGGLKAMSLRETTRCPAVDTNETEPLPYRHRTENQDAYPC